MRAPTEGWSAVACRLAMAEVRVQLPLGALGGMAFASVGRCFACRLTAARMSTLPNNRTWESLVFRVLRAHEIAGSNPAVLT